MTTVLTPRTIASTVTTSRALVAGQHTPVDATGGNLTETLPSSATPGAYLSVEKVDPSGNTVTISGSIRGAITTIPITTQYESVTLSWSGATWRPTEGRVTLPAINTAIDGKIATQATTDAGTYVPQTQLAANSGVATLDSAGVVVQNPKLHGSRHGRGGADDLYGLVNAKLDYGAKGDGTTDDTTALQNFITYCVTNGKSGFIPDGTYKITSQLNFSTRPGWSIRGAHRGGTIISQATDNTPIFNLGSDTVSLMHTWRISDLQFTYANLQTSSNTAANPIYFNTMAYEGSLSDLTFTRGSYAMRVASGIGCPWGTSFDNLVFSSGLTVGAMDWSAGVNATPNNRFGRIFVDCANMVGPVFSIRGYNFMIDTIEFVAANQGAKLISLAAGTEVAIGALKLENGTYTASQNIFEHLGNGYASIGQLFVGGNAMVVTPASGFLYLLRHGTGSGYVEVGSIDASATTLTGNAFLVSAPGVTRIRRIINSGGWSLQTTGSSTDAQQLVVDSWCSGRAALDNGDADLTLTAGNFNIYTYNTTLTAPRVVTLPTGNNLFSGLWYEVIAYGAVNGANTITIKASTTTVATIATDKTRIRLTYRRSNANSALGWFVSGYGTLP